MEVQRAPPKLTTKGTRDSTRSLDYQTRFVYYSMVVHFYEHEMNPHWRDLTIALRVGEVQFELKNQMQKAITTIELERFESSNLEPVEPIELDDWD